MPERTPCFGISGSRREDHTPTVWNAVRAVVELLPPEAHLVVGCCVGIDAFVGRAAHARGLTVHGVVPAQRFLVATDYQDWCDTWEEMPPDSTFKARNQRLVDLSSVLLAFPEKAEDALSSRRSGTWQTVRLAREKPIPVCVLEISTIELGTASATYGAWDRDRVKQLIGVVEAAAMTAFGSLPERRDLFAVVACNGCDAVSDQIRAGDPWPAGWLELEADALDYCPSCAARLFSGRTSR